MNWRTSLARWIGGKWLVADRIIEIMNRAVAADPKAIKDLCEARVECNAELAADPTIQVGDYHFGDGRFSVGLLGILNGITGILGPEAGDREGWGLVTAVFEVKCPVHPESSASLTLPVGAPCQVEGCDQKLVLGDIEHFRRTGEPLEGKTVAVP